MSAEVNTVSKQRSLKALINEFGQDDNGATAIEYSLIIALIFLVIVAAVRSYTESTSEMYNQIDQTLQNG